MKTCPKCYTEHEKPGVFCSRKCANSRGPRTDEFKQAVSRKLTNRVGHPNPSKGKTKKPKYEKVCACCNSSFSTIRETQKYCSSVCSKQLAGGYREGSGRAKTGYYKGIYCGSTYELIWVIYCIDNDISFKRFDGLLEFNGTRYIPDFIIDNTIIEIKGFEDVEAVNRKCAVAIANGYTIKVLRKDDLKEQFEWVNAHYEYKNVFELYDDYKPKYKLTCNNCSSVFYRDKKSKTAEVFCSRICAGKGHTGRVR